MRISEFIISWLTDPGPLLFSCSCATAYILLAEEEATTIMEAERLFKQALKAGESCYRRSQQLQHHGTQYEAQHSKYSPLSIDISNNQNYVFPLLAIAHLLSQ